MGAKPARLWMGGGANPYLGFLGLADAIVVTADSVNMAGEAASTGKPVYVFDLPGRAAKFRRFHAALTAAGATRPLDGTPFAAWDYEPVNANPAVADAVRRAYLTWKARR
jgi:mitochondrial fission protein ELM1